MEKMVNNKRLDVLYAFDDNYAPFAGVSIYSLLSNNKEIDEIRIFAVMDNVCDDNKNKIQQTIDDFNRKLVVVDAKNLVKLMENLGVPMYRNSYATHYRNFFEMYLPDDVDYLLYIDSDSLVCGSLSNLLNLDFDGKCIAAVREAIVGKYKKVFGFSDEDIYYNAGVTFFDVNTWKERHYLEKIINHLKCVRSNYNNPDQDVSNIVLKGDVLELPLQYNFMPVHRAYSDKAYFKAYPSNYYYSSKEIQFARDNPIILHTYRFLGAFPWHCNNCHPDNNVFDYYLNQTRWSGYIKKKSKGGLLFTVEKIMYVALPKTIFLTVFSRFMYINFLYKESKLRGESFLYLLKKYK